MFDKKPITKFDYAWTHLPLEAIQEYLYNPSAFNPFENKMEDELTNKGFREIILMYDPDYIWYTAKVLLNLELHPMQCVILKQFFLHAFPMIVGSRGLGKSFILAVYALLRAILFPGSKIVITGAAFRQSKMVFDYLETIYDSSPVLQSIYRGNKPSARLPDFWTFYLGDSKILALPTGTGEKIRGIRGHVICCDEFNSISTEVYEIVISQFAAVSASPIENIKRVAKKEAMSKEGLEFKESKSLSNIQNQSIISGTMKYQFEPMAIYWKKYKDIIEGRGKNLVEQFGEVGANLDYRDFCIIRVPFELCPAGFMDEKIVARSRSTMHKEFYEAEFGCCPISDSMGFFKRSLIESCTAKPKSIDNADWPTWCPEVFNVKLRGDNDKHYVMGIDPAYNQDNLALIILELHPEHARIVYGWSTSKKDFNKQVEVNEQNYFNFCARKVRNLMKSFNIIAIGIDSQGGGYNIMEALHDEGKMEAGEVPLWPVVLSDKKQDTDDRAGSHILHIIQFSDANWTATSNHGMKKDMEDRFLLFPYFNSVLLGLASEKDKDSLKRFGATDSLEDAMLEIEELKDELCLIMRSTTPAGRERWDTPEIKLNTNKKDRMRKDRYSALLIANYLARSIQRTPPPLDYGVLGAAKGTTQKPAPSSKLYVGPEWFDGSSNLFRHIIR